MTTKKLGYKVKHGIKNISIEDYKGTSKNKDPQENDHEFYDWIEN